MSYAKAQKIFNLNYINKFLKKYLVKGIKRIVKNFRRNNGK